MRVHAEKRGADELANGLVLPHRDATAPARNGCLKSAQVCRLSRNWTFCIC